MKKIKAMIALTAVIAMAFTTVAMAAPSPVAGTVTVVIPGQKSASQPRISTPSQVSVAALASYISQFAAQSGTVPTVKATVSISAPADYKGGDVPITVAAAGLPDGAQNVFACIRLANGQIIVLPCTVRGGRVGFVAPAFGDVSIVQLSPAAQNAANASNATQFGTAPAKLH